MGGAVAPIPAGTHELVSGPRPLWHKQHRRAILFCSVFFAGAFLYGYDGVYMASLLGMDKFRLDYGERLENGKYDVSATNQSLFSSIIQAGEFVGSLSAAFVGDFLGRRGSLQTAVVVSSVGAILQIIVAGSVPLLVVGRLILGIGIGIVSNCAPLYLSEIPHASVRGSVVAGWQLLLAIGQVIGACIGQGTKDYTNTFSYRFPIAFILVITLMIFVFSFIVPESPRWLTSKKRDEKALRALKRIHKNADEPIQEVETEMQVLIEARSAEQNNEGNSSKWSDLILKKADRRRFICAFGILCCQQISGVQFIFSYATVFFQNIGIDKSFEMTIVVDILEVLGVVCSLFIVNRFGRRPLLISTGIFMTATDIVIGAIGTKRDRTDGENKAILAMIMLYVFFFNLAWGPLAWACATELAAGKNKTKIMAVGTAGFWLCCWAVTFTLPYLYNADKANLGPMTCFIYAGGGLISVLFVYFLIPETLGRSLEEIQVMMDLDVPTRSWEQYRVGTVQNEFGNDHFRQNVKRTRSGLHVEHKDETEQETADAFNKAHKRYDA